MAGTWAPLQTQPNFNADTMLLLTDGTVMCHEVSSRNWHKLSPDSSGNYVKGSWSSMAPLPNNSVIPASNGGPTNAPLYFASAVLGDGTVFVAGGEYNSGIQNSDILATQIYDPVSDTWSIVKAPTGWTQIGDAPSCVLPDGRLLLGSINSTATAIYDPVLQIWTAAANKGDSSSEETFTLLPNNTVLTVQCSNSPNAEKYLIATDKWVGAGKTPSTLPQACPGFVAEIGPAILLPNGRVFAIGATGNTALYTPPATPTGTDSWASGPTLTDNSGNTMFPMDAGAVLLPNGKVLCVGSPAPACSYPSPTTFFEYNPSTNLAAVVASPSNNGNPCYFGRFLLLPSGQVLFSANGTDIEVYTPDGQPDPSWKPTITIYPKDMILGHTYTITGTQLNGLSQAVSYGDDAQMATNYPLVQLKNTATGAVIYLRTYNHSTMGVATGTTSQSTNVQVPMSTQTGQYNLVIIANGISSDPVTVDVLSQDCYFLLDRSTFGQGEIQALINLNGTPAVIDPALYVVVEGFKPGDLGLNSSNLMNPPQIPSIPNPVSTISFEFSGPVIPEDPSLPPTPQRFTFPFRIVFQDDTAFNFPGQTESLTLTASFTSTTNTTVSSSAMITLIKNPNPFILHGDVKNGYPWYLSVDVRVFQMTAGGTKFGVKIPTTGAAQDVATTYITKVIKNLNSSPGSAGGEFDLLPQNEQAAALELAPTDTNNNPIYNFALARVRYRDIQQAKNVRLFFRLWATQQCNSSYDNTTTYRSGTNSEGQKVPVLGIQGDEIITIPFFAAKRVDTSTSQKMSAQIDDANIQPTINPDPLGGEVDSYYGCWLDINQPSDLRFPSRVTGNLDGPFVNMGTLFPIQQFVRSSHHCLVAEISFDPDQIPPSADPSTSDKLAQRNLTFVGIPNPGVLASRRAPQTFEIRPTPSVLQPDMKLDELMIEWGNTPDGSLASIYLPAVDAAEVLALAQQLYVTPRLSQVDAHTLQCPTGGVTYIPIPQGQDVNFAGLLTVDFPQTVQKGQVFNIIVKQVTSASASVITIASKTARRGAKSAAISTPSDVFNWRRVLGVFQLTIPVSTKEELLAPEERLLSILRWIEQAIPVESRWYLVFRRYVQQIADRVGAMGGDPNQIGPSPTGDWHKRHHHEREDEREERIHFTGKIEGLIYNHFGDFEGFLLESNEGTELRFESRETRVKDLVHRAWFERIVTTVIVERDEWHRPVSIILRGAPPIELIRDDD